MLVGVAISRSSQTASGVLSILRVCLSCRRIPQRLCLRLERSLAVVVQCRNMRLPFQLRYFYCSVFFPRFFIMSVCAFGS